MCEEPKQNHFYCSTFLVLSAVSCRGQKGDTYVPGKMYYFRFHLFRQNRPSQIFEGKQAPRKGYGNIKCGIEDNPRLFQLGYVVIHNQKIMNIHKKLAYFFSWLRTEFENSYTKLSSREENVCCHLLWKNVPKRARVARKPRSNG